MRVVLTVTQGPHRGATFTFDRHDTFLVGRSAAAHFRLPRKDRYFSRVHFVVEVNPPLCRLVDMKSRNGTFVNGRRAVDPVDLRDGDLIKGGQTVIQVAMEPSPPAPTVVVPPELLPGAAAAVPRAVTPPPVENRDAPVPTGSGPLPAGPAAAAGSTYVPAACPDLAALPEAARALLPPDYLDRIGAQPQPVPGYWLVDQLGQGGMGVVYRAVCRSDGAVVAVKTIRPAVSVKARDVERFLREAEILKQLVHANIVGFREMGEAAGELYFAMEYVPGTDAAGLLRGRGGPLPVRRAVGIVCQLLTALEYAHSKGFVHRDIKPANLLLTQSQGRGLVKLGDFGLARVYKDSRLSGLTMMGDIAGTAPFMPPEQITDYRNVGPTADQFSAAATLYVLLTDRPIHDFPADVREQLLMILQQDAVPIRSRRSDISDGLAAAVHRALSRDPEERFADVTGFRQALLPFAGRLGGEESDPPAT